MPAEQKTTASIVPTSDAPLAPQGFYGFQINSDQILYYENPPTITALIFKGGGARGLAYKALLDEMETNGKLADVTQTAGSSVGAIAAVFTAIPFRPGERGKFIESIDLTIAADIWPNNKPGIYKDPSNHDLSTASGLFGAIANEILFGGIYRGVMIKNFLRDNIQLHTTNALDYFINTQTEDETEKKGILDYLLSIGLLLKTELKDNVATFEVTKEITFKHFQQLVTRYPACGFKGIHITGTRADTKNLDVFNAQTTPYLPIYLAVRASMSIPKIYPVVDIPVYDKNGNTSGQTIPYMDGGCANNFPMKLAGDNSNHDSKNWQQYYADQAKLGVRVEYAEEMNILWKPDPPKGFFARLIDGVKRFVTRLIVGMDIYTPDEKIKTDMRNRFPQRIVQLYDEQVGLTEFHLTDDRKKKLLDSAAAKTKEYFAVHDGEKLRIINLNGNVLAQPENREIHERLMKHLRKASNDKDFDKGKTMKILKTLKINNPFIEMDEKEEKAESVVVAKSAVANAEKEQESTVKLAL